MLFAVKTDEGAFLVKADFDDGTGRIVGKNKNDCTAERLLVAGDWLKIERKY